MTLKVAQLMVVDGMPDYQAMMQKAGLDVELTKQMAQTEDDIISIAKDADAVIGIGSLQPFTTKVMANLPNCRFIASLGIGYDNMDIEKASENCIMVANVPDYCWEEVSDHIMALILACTRKIVWLNNDVKRGGWKAEPDPDMQKNIWPGMTSLRGQTLGIIGFGGVSRTLTPKAKGFGLNLITYDPYVPADVLDEYGVGAVSDLDQLLAESDIVAINTNLTPETRHIIGIEQLKKMKPTAVIVNAARGPLIDPKALYTALSERIILMAGLDVTEPEPITVDDPLLSLENCLVTAHSAHFSPSAFGKLLSRPAEEIVRVFKDGEWPIGMINKDIKDAWAKKWGPLK
ncbi:MAG: C-terminal binding protein [Desulfatiglans sp.]|nr:C-terminal binding protein [Thermodesulfobacteriota bacterium]MEE4351978.1 C-terminal binding protein [Desulfatiglans sp.]